MPPSDRGTILAYGDARWNELCASLDASIDAAVNADGWTGKDVFAHFARWQQHTIDDLRASSAGSAPSPVDGSEDMINDRWHEEDRRLPADVARARCIRSREELRSLLMGLSEEQWDRFGRACAPDVNGEHHDAHLRALPAQEAAR